MEIDRFLNLASVIEVRCYLVRGIAGAVVFAIPDEEHDPWQGVFLLVCCRESLTSAAKLALLLCCVTF
jgi:hypothetical protein